MPILCRAQNLPARPTCSHRRCCGLVVDSWMRLVAMVWNPALFFMGVFFVACCT